MPLIAAFLPGSAFSTAVGATVSTLNYALYWYLNSSFCVALVLIALASIMAWIYTVTLILLKHFKKLKLSASPTIPTFIHFPIHDEELLPPAHLLYLARWFTGLSMIHTGCWWLLTILIVVDFHRERNLANPSDSSYFEWSDIEPLICPSLRCNAFYAAVGGTIASASVATLQLVSLAFLLRGLQSAPLCIVHSRSISELLNHEMGTLVKIRQRAKEYRKTRERSSDTSSPRGWVRARIRRKHHSIASSTFSEESFGNHKPGSKHHLVLRSLPNRSTTWDESYRRSRAYSAVPDSSGRLQRHLSVSDAQSVVSFYSEKHQDRAFGEENGVKSRDYGYISSKVHSPRPMRHPSLTDMTLFTSMGTPSFQVSSPTESQSSDKPSIQEPSPPGPVMLATLGENRRSTSPSTPKARSRTLREGDKDESECETPKRAAQELRDQLSLALDKQDEVDALEFGPFDTPKGSSRTLPTP